MVHKNVEVVFEKYRTFRYMNYYGQRDNLRYNNKRAISLHVECHKKVYDDIKQYMNKREILKIENVAKTLDRSYQLNRVSLLPYFCSGWKFSASSTFSTSKTLASAIARASGPSVSAIFSSLQFRLCRLF